MCHVGLYLYIATCLHRIQFRSFCIVQDYSCLEHFYGRFTQYNFVACYMLHSDKSRTRSFSCKSNLQFACRGLYTCFKPYDNRSLVVMRSNCSQRQFCIVEIVYDFSMTRAARAMKIACNNGRRKSYRVNRPLKYFLLASR